MFKLVCMLAIPLLSQSAVQVKNSSYSLPGNTKYTAHEKVYHYILGATQVSVLVAHYGDRKNVVMLNLHDDEITSVEAARNVLQQSGGVLVNINNNYERLVSFTLRGKTYQFDPNRMFSRIGIMADLVKQNKVCNQAAVRAIEGFARFVLSKIPRTSTLIALHNNDHNNFSIYSYLKDEVLKKDVQAIYSNETHDVDNFFLTTDRKIFNTLRESGYNVILQHKKAVDDGSLSIYFGRRNKSYVNVEAETGQVKQQEQMIGRVVAWINKEISKGI
jgi:hypothetical protein